MRRGDVYELRPPRRAGREQRGPHFGVVVQGDAFLPRSVFLIVPTSRGARSASFRPETEIGGETTRVLVEQVGAVDVDRLGDFVGRASSQEMWGIDEGRLTVLGLR